MSILTGRSEYIHMCGLLISCILLVDEQPFGETEQRHASKNMTTPDSCGRQCGLQSLRA